MPLSSDVFVHKSVMILFYEISNFVSYSSTQLHLGMLLHKLSMESYLITLIYFNDGFGFVCGILTNKVVSLESLLLSWE